MLNRILMKHPHGTLGVSDPKKGLLEKYGLLLFCP